MRRLPESIAYAWGRTIARYSLWAVQPGRIRFEGDEELPTGSAIWVAWHGTNLIAMAVHHYLGRAGTCRGFVPPGLVGAGMRGWAEGTGIEPVPLPQDGTGNVQAPLKHVARALEGGSDVVIAVDGPHGPVGTVRPGPSWLGRLTGRPVIPVGIAARPAVRFPRWDRHLVPLPGARIAVVYGVPFRVARRAAIDESGLRALGAMIDAATRRAWELVRVPPSKGAPASSLWRPTDA